jgi:hypothetical protein
MPEISAEFTLLAKIFTVWMEFGRQIILHHKVGAAQNATPRCRRASKHEPRFSAAVIRERI